MANLLFHSVQGEYYNDTKSLQIYVETFDKPLCSLYCNATHNFLEFSRIKYLKWKYPRMTKTCRIQASYWSHPSQYHIRPQICIVIGYHRPINNRSQSRSINIQCITACLVSLHSVFPVEINKLFTPTFSLLPSLHGCCFSRGKNGRSSLGVNLCLSC